MTLTFPTTTSFLFVFFSFIVVCPGSHASFVCKFGDDFPPFAKPHVIDYLNPFAQVTNLPNSYTEIHFGNTTSCIRHIPLKLKKEAFAIVGSKGDGTSIICAVGNPYKVTKRRGAPEFSIGSGFAAFEVLEHFGFSFLRPLQPSIPIKLDLSWVSDVGSLNITSEPTFSFRAFHMHTEHPLELLELLQGADAVMPTSFADADNQGSVIPWNAMYNDLRVYLQWCLANKVNHIEWSFLTTEQWRKNGFYNSTLRQNRLRNITFTIQGYGLYAGVDLPIVDIQQHGYYMVTNPDMNRIEQAIEELQQNLNWFLHGANFDYITTESGFSEFTAPSCPLMLTLINYTANYAMDKYNANVFIKCHCSTGQTCKEYDDPRTGKPLNFNFLPMFASNNMGVLPHTIQTYSFDDPVSDVYGNTDNFRYMLDYMLYEAKNSTRNVVYRPETNYWVNVDIDVPLFLPINGERRLHDLRIILNEMKELNIPDDRVLGQNIFDSGWEYGSWLSDVIAARAAWNPHMDITERELAFRATLKPLSKLCNNGDKLESLMVDLVNAQSQLLIYGKYIQKNGSWFIPTKSQLSNGLNGFCYLSGVDPWTSLLATIKPHAKTQPARIDFHDQTNKYFPYVLPLLDAMNATFWNLTNEFVLYQVDACPDNAYIEEIVDSLKILSLRSAQMKLLFEISGNVNVMNEEEVVKKLDGAKNVIKNAQEIVLKREEDMKNRIRPIQRITGWRENPSGYGYGYLWTVHSLYYWWRDYGLVERLGANAWFDVCYLNLQLSLDLVFGFGGDVSRRLWNALQSNLKSLGGILGNCVAPPNEEYIFPRDLYRY